MTLAVSPRADISACAMVKCLGGFWTWILPELKYNYENMCRAVFAMEYGMPISRWSCALIGGPLVDLKGAAIVSVASNLAGLMIYKNSVGSTGVLDGTYMGCSSRMPIWGESLASGRELRYSSPYIFYLGSRKFNL